MKKMKKALALALAGVMMASALTGCGKQETAGGDTGDLELTLHMHFFGYCVYDDNWPVFKEAAKKTGVTLKGTAVETVSDSGQAYSTMLADKKLPDIIHYVGTDLLKSGMDGALIPLEDLIDQYAPHIKAFFEKCPEARVAATAADGHIYYIPGTLAPIGSGNVPSEAFFIRQDWLDKLGLKAPTTVDEYYEVLKAFKTQDPNGNGQADEIPYFDRAGTINDLYQLFAAHADYYINDQGQYVNGRTEDAYKTAVKELAKWYKEGLIDPEIFTRGQQAREQLLSSNIGGATHDWISSTTSYNDKYPEVAGLNFTPIAPPADKNGVVKEALGRSLLHGLGWGISKDNKHVERTMEYFDFWFTDEGSILSSYGIEGEDYTVENGEYKFTDTVLKADGGVPNYLRNIGAAVEIGSERQLGSELAGMNDMGKKAFEEYQQNNWVQDQLPILSYTQEQQDVLTANKTNLDTYCKEQEQKWIMGAEDVDANWDQYLATLKTMGNEDILRVYNEAYQSYETALKK